MHFQSSPQLSPLWTPDVRKWFGTRKNLKLTYNAQNTYFVYGSKKYFFEDVEWFKHIQTAYTSGGVVDKRILYLRIKVDNEELEISKDIDNDEDFLQAHTLQIHLREYQETILQQKYLQNQPIKFHISPESSLLIENKKLYYIDQGDKYEVLKIVMKDKSIVFKTKSYSFEAQTQEISDLLFLEYFTSEFAKLKAKYIQRLRIYECVKLAILFPIFLNEFIFYWYDFYGVLGILTKILAFWGGVHLAMYLYAPIVDKINSYFYAKRLKELEYSQYS